MTRCRLTSPLLVVALLLLGCTAAAAQAPATAAPRPLAGAPPQEIPLWENGAPGALGNEDRDRPTITVYRARSSTGTGVVVAPGGGYANLAMDHEGRQVASYFNAMGVTAFILKYRLGPRYRDPIPLQDAQRAMRLVRSRAETFGIKPDRIGLMGFSAGGHLASTVAVQPETTNADAADPIDRVSSRPDFLTLGYPVITFDPAVTHSGSVRNLLGDSPSAADRERLSNERHVTARTPPTFLFHTTADKGVPAENSVRFYLALKAAGVPAELHIFENGPHGVGLALGDPALGQWPVLLTTWMRGRGLLTAGGK